MGLSAKIALLIFNPTVGKERWAENRQSITVMNF
jgi:hypothetical protein